MKRLAALLPLPLALLLRYLASRRLDAVERLFSTGIYPAIAAPVSRLMSLCPIPVIELLVVIGLFFVLYSLLKKKPFRAVAMLSWVAALFVGFWGLNYLRMPLESTLNLTVAPSAPGELIVLCGQLAETANKSRTGPPEDIFAGVNGAMNAAARDWPIPAGDYGAPKAALSSPLLSLLMIEGITSPFTIEALVNAGIPDVSLPFVACHEAAHIRGFAREEDANLIAYLACAASGEPYFRYSGAVSALLHALSALAEVDPEAHAAAKALLSPAVLDDLADHATYWAQYRGTPAAQVSARVNDAYLGVAGSGDQNARAYGRVVDLLLALNRKEQESR